MSRSIGCVKWFNTKTGYGFIRSGENDIFVHHTALNSTGYNYLVTGEYVEFVQAPVEHKTHKFMASDVTGIGRGLLMCQTRAKNFAGKEESREAA
jgi:CspA family cold shock protein